MSYSIDLSKQEFLCQATMPDLKLNCDYEINGKVLVLPVHGNGRCTIDLSMLFLIT